MIPIDLAIALAGALNAYVVAAIILSREELRRQAAGIIAAIMLLMLGNVILLIGIDHLWGQSSPAVIVMEEAHTLAAGPLLLAFVGEMIGKRVRPILLVLPPLLVAVWLVFTAPGFHTLYVSQHTIGLQMAFTAAAIYLALIPPEPGGRIGRNRITSVRRLLALMLVLHAAQIIRFLTVGERAIENIVPVVLALAALLLPFLLFRSARVAAFQSLTAQGTAGGDPALARLRQAVEEGKLFARPGLKLADVAEATGLAPAEVTRLLRLGLGQTFPEYLTSVRIEAAKRLLADPAEARTSIDAIALLAGFGSRSTFYKSFTEREGQSPASWRTTP